MRDLISREAVIDVLKQTGIIVDNDLGNLVVAEIERIPTAYDVDKVVEQLRESDSICSRCFHRKNPYVCSNICDIGKRLKIVKAGGLNDN